MPTGAFVARRNGKVFVTGNSGFPKSHDVSKAIDREAGAKREVVGPSRANIRADLKYGGNDPSHNHGRFGAVTHPPITAPATEAARQWEGHGTALKPAWEPIIVARKPLDGTVAQNVQRWGCGGLAIDASRVEHDEQIPTFQSNKSDRWLGRDGVKIRQTGTTTLGRWPANVIFDHEAGAILDAQSGTLTSGSRAAGVRKGIGYQSSAMGDGGPGIVGNSGGASRFFKSCDYTEEDARFFYCAKASRKERDAGLEDFEPSLPAHGYATLPDQRMDREQVRNPPRNTHPTVKPLALTTYLARLILPPVEGARLLVPFCGSGSEMLGGTRAGWAHVEGIDSWDVAVKIARARLAHHEAQSEPANDEQLTLEVGT